MSEEPSEEPTPPPRPLRAFIVCVAYGDRREVPNRTCVPIRCAGCGQSCRVELPTLEIE